jgi:DNA-binding NarL/FixJ family response regulator
MSHALRPQVIILDMHMPGGVRIDPNYFRTQLHPSSKVLAISIWNDEETAMLAEQIRGRQIDRQDGYRKGPDSGYFSAGFTVA